jgi:hypothetical protein
MANLGTDTKLKEQAILNRVYDDDTNSLNLKTIEVSPTDFTKINPSLVFAYDGSGNLTTVTKTIDGTNYVKTLTYDESNNLVSESVWV